MSDLEKRLTRIEGMLSTLLLHAEADLDTRADAERVARQRGFIEGKRAAEQLAEHHRRRTTSRRTGEAS